MKKELIKDIKDKVYFEEIYKGYVIGSRLNDLHNTEYIIYHRKIINRFIGGHTVVMSDIHHSNSIVECRKFIKGLQKQFWDTIYGGK